LPSGSAITKNLHLGTVILETKCADPAPIVAGALSGTHRHILLADSKEAADADDYYRSETKGRENGETF